MVTTLSLLIHVYNDTILISSVYLVYIIGLNITHNSNTIIVTLCHIPTPPLEVARVITSSLQPKSPAKIYTIGVWE